MNITDLYSKLYGNAGNIEGNQGISQSLIPSFVCPTEHTTNRPITGSANIQTQKDFDERIKTDPKRTIFPAIQLKAMLAISDMDYYLEIDRDITDRRLVGFESTARAHIDGSILAPRTIFRNNILIPEKEIFRKTAVIESKINQVRAQKRLPALTASVNVSTIIFDQLTEVLGAIFDPTQIQNIVLELVENLDLSQQPTSRINELRSLTSQGYRISIDDYGREHSEENFRLLNEQDIPIYEVKFDGIDTRRYSEDRASAVKTIIKLARLGVRNFTFEGTTPEITFAELSSIAEVTEQFRDRLRFYYQGSIVR